MVEEQSPLKRKVKEFGLTSFAVDNGTSFFIITLMIVIFGIGAYESMPKEQFPEVSFPTVYVNTPYFGNSAADIENLVTRPIEKEIKSIVGLKNVKSTSLQDFSVITAEFETYMDIDEAVRKVKDAVDKAKSDLPNDLTQDPDIFDVNLSEIPIMTVNLSGKYTNDELRSFAEYLEDEIEAIDEISGVEIKGSLEREVKIDVDLPRMDALEVSFQDIENAVNWENMNMSAGEIVNDGFRRAVRRRIRQRGGHGAHHREERRSAPDLPGRYCQGHLRIQGAQQYCPLGCQPGGLSRRDQAKGCQPPQRGRQDQ